MTLLGSFIKKNGQDSTALASEALYISSSACRHYNGAIAAFIASILPEI